MEIFVKTKLKQGKVSYPDNYSLTGFMSDLLQPNGFIEDGLLEIKDMSNNRILLDRHDWGKHQGDLVGNFFKGVSKIEINEFRN